MSKKKTIDVITSDYFVDSITTILKGVQQCIIAGVAIAESFAQASAEENPANKPDNNKVGADDQK